jgi:hypothetical protein
MQPDPVCGACNQHIVYGAVALAGLKSARNNARPAAEPARSHGPLLRAGAGGAAERWRGCRFHSECFRCAHCGLVSDKAHTRLDTQRLLACADCFELQVVARRLSVRCPRGPSCVTRRTVVKCLVRRREHAQSAARLAAGTFYDLMRWLCATA